MSTTQLGITDLETSRLDPFSGGEILEIGIVVVDEESLQTLRELDLKVRPEHLALADPESLRVNGFTTEDWADAIPLADAMGRFAATVHSAEIATYNIKFDWPFLASALHTMEIQPEISYHGRCVYTLACEVLRSKHLPSYGLSAVAEYLGLGKEPLPHRAIYGARLAAEVYRKLRAMLP